MAFSLPCAVPATVTVTPAVTAADSAAVTVWRPAGSLLLRQCGGGHHPRGAPHGQGALQNGGPGELGVGQGKAHASLLQHA